MKYSAKGAVSRFAPYSNCSNDQNAAADATREGRYALCPCRIIIS